MKQGEKPFHLFFGMFTSGQFVSTNTTSCLLHCFLLACAGNPSSVKRAHIEFQRVLGARAPTWEDFYDLPYLFSVVKELLRWCPVTPLAFPHCAEVDDQYRGQKVCFHDTWKLYAIHLDLDIWRDVRDSKCMPESHLFMYNGLISGVHLEYASQLRCIFQMDA